MRITEKDDELSSDNLYMKIFIALLSFGFLLNSSFAGSDCVECDNMASAQSSSGSGKGLIASMGKITKGLKHDYQGFCSYMVENNYQAGFKNLRDHHKQVLEEVYTEIKCGEVYGPVMEFATIGQAGTSVVKMIKYLKIMGRKHKKDYLTPVLNYIEPSKPNDRSLLDIAQEAIDQSQTLKQDAKRTYQTLRKNGAKHSYNFCMQRNLDTQDCLDSQ